MNITDMTNFHILASLIAQGITEAMPVSSTLHLLMLSEIFKIEYSNAFDVLLHVGSLLAFTLYTWPDIKLMMCSLLPCAAEQKQIGRRFVMLMITVSLPVIITGYLFNYYGLEQAVKEHPQINLILAITAIVFGFILFVADGLKKTKVCANLNFRDSLIVGLSQAITIIPGCSRLGVCISAMLLLGYKRVDALYLGILFGVPIIAGAIVLKLPVIVNLIVSLSVFKFSILVFCIFSINFLILNLMEMYINKITFKFFGVYRIIIGTILLLYINKIF